MTASWFRARYLVRSCFPSLATRLAFTPDGTRLGYKTDPANGGSTATLDELAAIAAKGASRAVVTPWGQVKLGEVGEEAFGILERYAKAIELA